MWTGCGRTLQESTGRFGWPDVPQDSLQSTSVGAAGGSGPGATSVSVAEPCQWRISGTHGERIVVNISELRLASTDCVTDYLELRDGHWYRSPLLGQQNISGALCGCVVWSATDLQSEGCRFESRPGLLRTKVYSAFHPSGAGK